MPEPLISILGITGVVLGAGVMYLSTRGKPNRNCSNCTGCSGCVNCSNCVDCEGCNNCSNSQNLINCNNCSNCSNIENESNQSNVHGPKKTSDGFQVTEVRTGEK